MQRFLDIVLSLAAITFLSPVLIPTVLLLRLTGEGEVMYLQPRIGRYGKVFNLYKFATMKKNSPSTGAGPITVQDDPRVLRVGKLLRKSKINELPQLLNILFGQMSIVGPRPMTMAIFEAYDEDVQNIIKTVRPGLSGIGSVVFRNEESLLKGALEGMEFYKEVISPYKGALEVWFVNNNSLINYLKVIYFTLLLVLGSDAKKFWRSFPSLPNPPKNLEDPLGFHTN